MSSLPTTSHAVPACLVILLLGAAGCSSSPTSSTNHVPAPTVNDITIGANAATSGSAAFTPNPKDVSLGSATTATVRFVNDDDSGGGAYSSGGVTHHIVSDDGTSFDTGNLGLSAVATLHLAAGTYAFHCILHPTMTGSVVVTP